MRFSLCVYLGHDGIFHPAQQFSFSFLSGQIKFWVETCLKKAPKLRGSIRKYVVTSIVARDCCVQAKGTGGGVARASERSRASAGEGGAGEPQK